MTVCTAEYKLIRRALVRAQTSAKKAHPVSIVVIIRGVGGRIAPIPQFVKKIPSKTPGSAP